MTFFDCTADLVGQLNGNGYKGMLQTDEPLSKISVYTTARLVISTTTGAIVFHHYMQRSRQGKFYLLT